MKLLDHKPFMSAVKRYYQKKSIKIVQSIGIEEFDEYCNEMNHDHNNIMTKIYIANAFKTLNPGSMSNFSVSFCFFLLEVF